MIFFEYGPSRKAAALATSSFSSYTSQGRGLDLRQVREVPESAIRTAVEVNSDPSARNIRLAVVVNNEAVASAIRKIAALALPESAAAIKIFTDMDEAETWLSRPLDQIA